MKINWKVRMKHKQFWVSIIALLAVLANQVAAIFSADITLISTQLTDVSETILLILSAMGIIIDPTSSGLSDEEEKLNK